MNTATAPAPSQHRQQTPHGTSKDAAPLDQVIEQTTKQQSIVKDAASILGVPWQKVCDLLRNVWKTSKDQPPLTDQEMFSGISMIARYKLDPIAKEIYVSRDNKGRLMTIIGIDGFVKILDRTDHYDGHEAKINELPDGTVDWIETIIHSKKRKYPTIYRAYAKEYAKLAGFMHAKIPIHMLRLFSLHHATRLFTPIGGNVLTKEEAEFVGRNEPDQDNKAPNPTELENMLKPIEAVVVPESAVEELPESSYTPSEADGEKPTQPKLPPWDAFLNGLRLIDRIGDVDYLVTESLKTLPPERHNDASAEGETRKAELQKKKKKPGTLLDTQPDQHSAGQ